MIKESLATATINRNLERLHVLTRMLNMNWENATKQDIEELIITVIQKYAENGQETDTTYDFKRSQQAIRNYIQMLTSSVAPFMVILDGKKKKIIVKRSGK